MEKPFVNIAQREIETQLEVCDMSDKGPKKKCCKNFKKKKGKYCKRCPKLLIN